MAQDPLQELRSTISQQLQRFWHPDISAGVSASVTALGNTALGQAGKEVLRPLRTTNPRFGAREAPEANALREEVAFEIAAMLRNNPNKDASFDTIVEDTENAESTESAEASAETRGDIFGSNEQVAHAGSNRTVNELPLGARLKPRGIFEDDWTARPNARRPWPVILLHGTADSKGIWQILGGELRQDGWAVFAPDYGTRATGLIPESAVQVGAYIDAVLAATGAKKAVIIGHSQGGLLARYWMRLLGGAAKTRHLICIGSPNHGTTRGGIISPLVATKRSDAVVSAIINSYFGAAGQQQIVGSTVIDEVNAEGDLDPGVTYTCIATKSDAVVVPPETCFLDSTGVPDGVVRNVYVQDFDRRAVVLHENLPVDKRVRAIVRTILHALTALPNPAANAVDVTGP